MPFEFKQAQHWQDDRAAGSSVGLGTRAAGRVGRKDLRSCVGTPRMLRLLRDPVTNAEASTLERANEESWVPFGLGWATLLPSRGTVHEKGASLPRLTRRQWISNPRGRTCGCRSTDGTRHRRIVRPTRPTARESSRRRSSPPGRGPFGAQVDEDPTPAAARRQDLGERREPISTSASSAVTNSSSSPASRERSGSGVSMALSRRMATSTTSRGQGTSRTRRPV